MFLLGKWQASMSLRNILACFNSGCLKRTEVETIRNTYLLDPCPTHRCLERWVVIRVHPILALLSSIILSTNWWNKENSLVRNILHHASPFLTFFPLEFRWTWLCCWLLQRQGWKFYRLCWESVTWNLIGKFVVSTTVKQQLDYNTQ